MAENTDSPITETKSENSVPWVVRVILWLPVIGWFIGGLCWVTRGPVPVRSLVLHFVVLFIFVSLAVILGNARIVK